MNVIDNFFEQLNNMPMLPKVVQEVTQLLNADDVDMKALANKINHDQVLAAKVLRMSNSAYFGCSRTISSIEEAVGLIGLAKLKTLVIASGVTGAFANVPGLDLKRFWKHSLITASIARQLADDLGRNAETAYIAALMHTVGQLPIHLVFPEAGAKVDEACKGSSVLERVKVEQAILGLDHTYVGEKLAGHWNFPDEIARVIRYYADPLNEQACSLAPVVYAAAHIAFDCEAGKEADYIAGTIDTDVSDVLDIDQAEWAEKIATYQVFVQEAESFMA